MPRFASRRISQPSTSAVARASASARWLGVVLARKNPASVPSLQSGTSSGSITCLASMTVSSTVKPGQASPQSPHPATRKPRSNGALCATSTQPRAKSSRPGSTAPSRGAAVSIQSVIPVRSAMPGGTGMPGLTSEANSPCRTNSPCRRPPPPPPPPLPPPPPPPPVPPPPPPHPPVRHPRRPPRSLQVHHCELHPAELDLSQLPPPVRSTPVPPVPVPPVPINPPP